MTWLRRGAPLLAAAAVLLVGSLLSRSPAPSWVPQRSPSGRVYKLVRTSPIVLPGGAQGLGVEYLPDDIRDADRLALDAEEIVALVSDFAVKGKMAVVVVAALKPRALLGDKKVVFGYARGRDGVWRRRPGKGEQLPPMDASDARALDDVYARFERGVRAKDAAELESLQAPEFWHKLADGGRRDRDAENQSLEKSFSQIKTITPRLRVSSLSFYGPYAVAVASMTSVGTLAPSAGGRRFRDVTVSRDTWAKTPDGWRLFLSWDLSEDFEAR